MKEMGMSIVLNLFLGYLWLLFIDHVVQIANAFNQPFWIGGVVMVVGTLLFGEIFRRMTPFHTYKFTHPVRLAGVISFGLVVAVHIFVVNII
ncbi:hypothetical protein [Thalassobacillus hwangdonensis]|uniref:Uncharacterized protein n=1 Tax=Thalassobacillus hwangdonensis TaxID=546108 RepID=A0ABW3L1X3_9BACI